MLLKKEVCNRQNIPVSTCNKYSLDEDRSIIATNVYVQISSESILYNLESTSKGKYHTIGRNGFVRTFPDDTSCNWEETLPIKQTDFYPITENKRSH